MIIHPENKLYISEDEKAVIYNNITIPVSFFKELEKNQSRLENESVTFVLSMSDNLLDFEVII